MNTPQRGLLKRPSSQGTQQPASSSQAYTKPSGNHCVEETTVCICELINASISFHKLHLKVNGVGAYATHMALGPLYEELPDLVDTITEAYQGAAERILVLPDCCPRSLNSVEEAIVYIREIYDMICALQDIMCFSEINNELDNIKRLLSSTKYKLLFLK
jgi:DNA-binding ferritin-like protein